MPRYETMIIEADGGSRGNPGVAGSGTVLIDDATGQIVERLAYVVGIATNNVAEYHALLNGLRRAQELGARTVHVRMDSKLVVEQMSGRWKIKHPDMKQLALECQAIARSFSSVDYTWVPRKKNARADELANLAMDALAKDSTPAGTFLDLGSSPAQEQEATKEAPSTSSSSKPAAWNGATSEATRFLLLRHGQTAMSAAKQYSGHSNPPLSELGEQQAAAAAHYLAQGEKIDVIVSSPLRRTMQTAEAVAQQIGQKVIQDPGLIELDFGTWDGLTFAQAHAADPELHSQWLTDTTVAPPQGESLRAAYRRIKKTREELQEKYPGQTILVVSHVTPIKSILRHGLDAGPGVYQRIHLDLASLSIVDFYADGPTCVHLINGTSYLDN